MDSVKEKINAEVERAILSGPVGEDCKYRKIDVNQITLNGKPVYQISNYTDKQVFQQNVKLDDLKDIIIEAFGSQYKQLNIFTSESEYSFKFTKKGKLLQNKTKRTNTAKKITIECNGNQNGSSLGNTHNRTKNYILKEGVMVPALYDMGIFAKDGKVVKSMYDKFKQINRFVELVDDVLKNSNEKSINVIDFGCGKSYLTFVLYYYLKEIKKIDVNIVGLDLKEDVIKKCNETAERYGYDHLHFELGDVNGYKSEMRVDMVVTLHACDTATDYALYNAVNWNAKYILSVPCCQHEVNKQITSEVLSPMMKYGIIKERTAALATDAIRGVMLEYSGYKTQLLEFVDLAHSPKNILIRAVKSNISKDKKEKAFGQATEMCSALGINPTIYKLLK